MMLLDMISARKGFEIWYPLELSRSGHWSQSKYILGGQMVGNGFGEGVPSPLWGLRAVHSENV